jgi:uncharacterized protein YbjT (DUF2867 family)
MAALLLEGWLVKDGNMLGSWKNRFCTLTFSDNQFTLEYYVSDNKAEKKGTFIIPRNSGFSKVVDSGDIKNCFSLEVSQSGSGSRKAGTRVTFSAPTVESYNLWEKAFVHAKPPVGVMPGVGKSFGKPELMVIGASGYVGVATVNSLVAYSKDFIIKAGVRDISSPKNTSLVGTGIKLVAADMSKPKTLVQALNGVKAAFIVVPGHADRTALAIAGIKACKDAGVQHIVVLSVCSVVKPGTIFADQFIPIEEYTKTCGIPYTIVRLPMFMENVLGQMQSIATAQQFYTPLDASVVQNCASVGDIGETVAKIMAKSEMYVNKTLSLTGTPVKESDFAAAFTEVLGQKVSHITVPYASSKQSMMEMGMPEWQVDGIVELYKMVASLEPCLTADGGEMRTILGRDLATPASLAAYVAPGLKAIKQAAEYESEQAAKEAAEKLAALKLAADQAEASVKAAEKAKADKAAAEKRAAQLKATRAMVQNGGNVLKKMSTEAGYKLRCVWLDDAKKTLNWSKTDKTGASKSLQCGAGVTVSKPEASGAKAASMFGSAEPDGYVISVTEAPGKPSVDLKVGSSVSC